MLVLERGIFFGDLSYLHADNGMTLSLTPCVASDVMANSEHYHEHPNLYFVLKGGSLEKKSRLVEKILPGDLRFYHAGEKHQNMRLGKCESLNIEIEFPLLHENAINEGQIDKVIRSYPESKLLLLKILKELKTSDEYTTPSVRMLLLQLLTHLDHPVCRRKPPKWVTQIHALLNDCWNEKITLQQLSDRLGLSPVSISKYFPSYFGCTLGEFMRKLKIERSLGLIKTGHYSLTEIAYLCGFADQSHFIRTFKTQTGFLPHQYRAMGQ